MAASVEDLANIGNEILSKSFVTYVTADCQRLSQRPVQPSFGRHIFSLDMENIARSHQIALWEDPKPRPGPTICKFGLTVTDLLQCVNS